MMHTAAGLTDLHERTYRILLKLIDHCAAKELAAERVEHLEKLQHAPSDETYDELQEQRRRLETREALVTE